MSLSFVLHFILVLNKVLNRCCFGGSALAYSHEMTNFSTLEASLCFGRTVISTAWMEVFPAKETFLFLSIVGWVSSFTYLQS